MSLADAQDRGLARLALDKNIVVEAGAGTGKTTLLSDRALFTLLGGGPKGKGTALSRVVALTFTEKAAGEIKERLYSRLQDILTVLGGGKLEGRAAQVADEWLDDARSKFKADEERVRKTVEEALAGMDRAMIGTIHHFAAHLLRLHPLEAGVDPKFEVDEGRRFEELFDAEWALFLDKELGLKAPRREMWIAVLRLASMEDLETLARALCSESARQSGLGTTPAMKKGFSALARRFAHLSKDKPPPGGQSKIIESLSQAGPIVSRLAASLDEPGDLPELPSKKPVQKRSWPKKWRESGGEEDYLLGLRAVNECTAYGESLIAKCVELLLPFAERFRAEYTRRGFVSLDGLLTKARDLVRKDPVIRERLKHRYDSFLIDEFQDTDPLQGELLLLLGEKRGGKAKSWDTVEFAPGKLFVVGDPKQSIYRFRGADIRAYERFTTALLDQGALACTLRTNFRSIPGIIDPVNAVFAPVMRYEADLQPEYKEICAAPDADKGEGPAVELALVTNPANPMKPAGSGAANRTQAAWLAERLKSEYGTGRLQYKDVAVLFRTMSPVGEYLDAFRSADVPVVVEADRYFYGTQEVVDFMNLLRVLDDPSDKTSLAGLLRSPLVCLTDRELLFLAEADALDFRKDIPKAALRDKPRARAGSFFKTLRELSRSKGREPLGDFTARVLDRTFLLEHAAAAYHREQTLANLMKFYRLAAELSESEGATLKELIAEVAKQMEAGAREGESPLADEAVDAVRILTMHKAKGLEYPVVVLPELQRSPGGAKGEEGCVLGWSEETLGLRLCDSGYSDIAWVSIDEGRKAREERERIRLLYVAMTRAKKRLILMGTAVKGDRNSLSAILHASGAWPEKGQRPEAMTLEGGVELPVSYLEPESGAKPRHSKVAVPLRIPAKEHAKAWTGIFKEAAELREKRLFTTPTEYLRDEAPDWSFKDEEDESLTRPKAMLVGDLCHKVLQYWDFGGKEDLEAAVAGAAAKLQSRHPVADWPGVLDESAEILKTFLRSDPAKALAEADILGRELPFVMKRDGAVMRGTIDLVYRKDGRLVVADYKTGRPGKDFKEYARRYARQGRAYVDAVGGDAGFEVIFLRAGRAVSVDSL